MSQTPVDPLRERFQVKPAGPPPTPGSKSSMLPLILAAVALVITVVLGVLLMRMESRHTESIAAIEEQLARLSDNFQEIRDEAVEQVRQGIEKVETDLQTVRARVGETRSEAVLARRQVEDVRQTTQAEVQSLTEKVVTKADTVRVEQLEEQADAKFQELDQQIDGVQEEVAASRTELEQTLQELSNLGLQVTEQGKLIAVTEEGIAELKRRGERDYHEFNMARNGRQTVAGIGLELRRTNQKNHHANISLFYDDKKIERNKVYANSPLTFYVGPERTPYELVINSVVKNQIRGYVSVPAGAVTNTRELQRNH